jgi:hypothetical protein
VIKAVQISSVVALAGYAAFGGLSVANAASPLTAIMLADARPVNPPTVVQTSGTTAPQAVASAEPSVKPAADDSSTAGGLLKRAFEFFKNDQNRAAADTFKSAIATGNLNDAGRALAYWHIFVAEEAMGNRNASSDALSSFVVVAQDVMEIRERLRYAEDDSGDFVDRFDLKRRLARARALLSVAWAYHTNWFGRSTTAPVPVHSTAEMNYFLELAPPCARSHDRKVQASIAHPVAGESTSMSEVDLSCDGSHDKTSYYFQVVAEDGQGQ